MTPKKFRSKIDWWIVAILAIGLGIQTSAMFVVGAESEDPTAIVIMIVATLLLWALIGSTLLMTYYSIEGPILKVRSGPFRWKIPIDEIHEIRPTRNPLSSPALSLDRLRISWGKKRKIMVSPADKDRFVKALGMELTNG